MSEVDPSVTSMTRLADLAATAEVMVQNAFSFFFYFFLFIYFFFYLSGGKKFRLDGPRRKYLGKR